MSKERCKKVISNSCKRGAPGPRGPKGDKGDPSITVYDLIEELTEVNVSGTEILSFTAPVAGDYIFHHTANVKTTAAHNDISYTSTVRINTTNSTQLTTNRHISQTKQNPTTAINLTHSHQFKLTLAVGDIVTINATFAANNSIEKAQLSYLKK
jgi:hypothetical protein